MGYVVEIGLLKVGCFNECNSKRSWNFQSAYVSLCEQQTGAFLLCI